MRNVLIMSILFCAINLTGQVTTWQAPEGFASDKYYSVKVNGVQVPVFDTPIAYMGKRLTDLEHAKIRQQNTEKLIIR